MESTWYYSTEQDFQPGCVCPETLVQPGHCSPLECQGLKASPGNFPLVSVLE